METLLQQIITSNIGTIIIVLILWRSGLLKFLINKNGGNNQLKDVSETVAKLEQHYNSETTILLTEITQQLREHGQKLDKISDGITWLKAKSNGKM
jgi:hypothetical protein